MNTKKLKIGSTVKIISGKHKGNIGKIKKVIIKNKYLIVENINIKIKHIKPKKTDEQGQIQKIEAPIHISNVQIIQENN